MRSSILHVSIPQRLSCLGGGDPTRSELVERSLSCQQLSDVIGHTASMTDALDTNSSEFELRSRTRRKRGDRRVCKP